MSTRATYKIDGTTFYIHHDGYPAGAAAYFQDALDYPRQANERAPNASFVDDFMRANLRAEITESHEADADTEYRYTVTTEGDFRFGPSRLKLIAETRDWVNGDAWERIFAGDLREFITENTGLIPS